MRKSIREQFADMTRLYHFTDFSSACKIIGSKKLRFGKMFKMNDLIESNRIVFERLALLNLEESKNNSLFAEKEMHRYQQISFSPVFPTLSVNGKKLFDFQCFIFQDLQIWVSRTNFARCFSAESLTNQAHTA